MVLTTYSGDAQVMRALKAGAQAYLLKNSCHKELLATIRAVYAGIFKIDVCAPRRASDSPKLLAGKTAVGWTHVVKL